MSLYTILVFRLIFEISYLSETMQFLLVNKHVSPPNKGVFSLARQQF